MNDLEKRLVRLVAASRWFASLRAAVEKSALFEGTLRLLLLFARGAPVFFNNGESALVYDLITTIKLERELLLNYVEAQQLYNCVKDTVKVEGVLVEVGVFQGASAKLICEAKGEKQLYLFDTFEGIPAVSEIDPFERGQFRSSYEEVARYLKRYPGVTIVRGLFPTSGQRIADERVSFAHLDVDTFESTLASLGFLYPRMSSGGVLMSHDYRDVRGVRKAFDDFFSDKPEPVIELAGSYCMIPKL